MPGRKTTWTRASLALSLAAFSLSPSAVGLSRVAPREAFTKAFEALCQYGDEYHDELVSEREKLCVCLGKDSGACRKDGDLERWEKQILSYLSSEILEASVTSLCLSQVLDHRLSQFHSRLEQVCATNPSQASKLARFPASVVSDQTQCRRIVNLTEDGCLVAKSCDGKAAEVQLCNSRLTRTHARRDPELRTSGYHLAVTQAHFDHSVYPHGEGTYAAANCHGTAEMLAGEFLGEVLVTKQSAVPAYVAQCGEETKALYDKARGEKTFPTIRDLNLRRGVAINMVYGSCKAEECGSAEMVVDGCRNGPLESYVFISGMCIRCWEKHLLRAGYQALPAEATWTALYPGCILNQDDHSSTVVGISEGMCTSYEAPSPYASPELKTAPCPSYFAKFPRRWCPAVAMPFTIRPSGRI